MMAIEWMRVGQAHSPGPATWRRPGRNNVRFGGPNQSRAKEHHYEGRHNATEGVKIVRPFVVVLSGHRGGGCASDFRHSTIKNVN